MIQLRSIQRCMHPARSHLKPSHILSTSKGVNSFSSSSPQILLFSRNTLHTPSHSYPQRFKLWFNTQTEAQQTHIKETLAALGLDEASPSNSSELDLDDIEDDIEVGSVTSWTPFNEKLQEDIMEARIKEWNSATESMRAEMGTLKKILTKLQEITMKEYLPDVLKTLMRDWYVHEHGSKMSKEEYPWNCGRECTWDEIKMMYDNEEEMSSQEKEATLKAVNESLKGELSS